MARIFFFFNIKISLFTDEHEPEGTDRFLWIMLVVVAVVATGAIAGIIALQQT